MRIAPCLSVLLLVAACGGDATPGPTGEVVEQLEAAEVHPVDAQGDAFEGMAVSGALSVTGADRDFTLTVADPSGEQSIDLHLPGKSELLSLDGRDVELELSGAGLHEERAVFVRDEAGPLFIVDDGWHRDDVEALMGEGFVTWGETVGTTSDDQYDWTYTTALFQTDDGEVALRPGEAQTITVDGVSWRVVAIAAYQVTPHPDAALPCGGIDDMLSYELMRVEAEAPATTIVRPSDATMAHLGCL